MSTFYERKECIRSIEISDKKLEIKYKYRKSVIGSVSFWDALFYRKPKSTESGFYDSYNNRYTAEQILEYPIGETSVYMIEDNMVYVKPSYRIRVKDGNFETTIYDYFDTFEDVEKFVNEFIKVNGLGEDFIIIY